MRPTMCTATLFVLAIAGAPVGSDLVACCADGEVEVIRLRVGREIVVELDRDSFDETGGIDATRLDDGGQVHLGWEQMHPEDAQRIRASFGFFSDEPEPVMLEAEKFIFGGGVEFIGVLEEQGPDGFTIRMQGKTKTFPWGGLRRREPVRVNALEIYDAETLYNEEFGRNPPQSAIDHYNLALYCEGIDAWDRVVQHLDEARALDAELKGDTLERKRARAEARIAAAEDAAELQAAERLAAYDGYDRALAKIDQFLAANPGSSLRAEFENSRRKILERREKWLFTKVNMQFFVQLDRFAHTLALSKELTVNDARKEMERNATSTVLERVAELLEVPVEDAERVWQSPERPRSSPRLASYGAGSFILGEQDVFEGMKRLDEQEEEESGGSSADDGGNDVQERIRRILEERERRKKEQERGGPQRRNAFRIADVPPNKDEWWSRVAKASEKKNFLLAYWAEHDEHVRRINVSPKSCVRCAGEGRLRSFTSDGQEVSQPCDRCKGLRIDRVVRYH